MKVSYMGKVPDHARNQIRYVFCIDVSDDPRIEEETIFTRVDSPDGSVIVGPDGARVSPEIFELLKNLLVVYDETNHRVFTPTLKDQIKLIYDALKNCEGAPCVIYDPCSQRMWIESILYDYPEGALVCAEFVFRDYLDPVNGRLDNDDDAQEMIDDLFI